MRAAAANRGQGWKAVARCSGPWGARRGAALAGAPLRARKRHPRRPARRQAPPAASASRPSYSAFFAALRAFVVQTPPVAQTAPAACVFAFRAFRVVSRSRRHRAVSRASRSRRRPAPLRARKRHPRRPSRTAQAAPAPSASRPSCSAFFAALRAFVVQTPPVAQTAPAACVFAFRAFRVVSLRFAIQTSPRCFARFALQTSPRRFASLRDPDVTALFRALRDPDVVPRRFAPASATRPPHGARRPRGMRFRDPDALVFQTSRVFRDPDASVLQTPPVSPVPLRARGAAPHAGTRRHALTCLLCDPL
jgi:hypothetical protein